MPHLRQALLVIIVVLAMYLLAGGTGWLLSRLLAAAHYDLFVFADRASFFLCGLLAGAVLVQLLTWRLRILAMLALPVLVLLILPTIAYLRVRTFIEGDVSYVAMWPYYVYLGMPVLGMLVGGMLSARLTRRAPTSPVSADTP